MSRMPRLILCAVAFMTLGGSCLADSVETNYVFGQAVQKVISSEKSLAMAESNFVAMSRDRSNDPPFLGKLELAMAFRYSRNSRRIGTASSSIVRPRCAIRLFTAMRVASGN